MCDRTRRGLSQLGLCLPQILEQCPALLRQQLRLDGVHARGAEGALSALGTRESYGTMDDTCTK